MTAFHEDDHGRLHALVDSLGNDLDPSILIGGWATYLRLGGGEISLDIDLIINDPSLRTTLQHRLVDYSESHHHGAGSTKGRGTVDGVHIDAYIPWESRLGDRLLLRVERLTGHTEPGWTKGWLLLTLEAHIITKMAALLDRPDSIKGGKDAREIVALLALGADARAAISVLYDAAACNPEQVPGYVRTAFELAAARGGTNKSDRRVLDGLRRDWVLEAELGLERRRRKGDEPRGPGPKLSR